MDAGKKLQEGGKERVSDNRIDRSRDGRTDVLSLLSFTLVPSSALSPAHTPPPVLASCCCCFVPRRPPLLPGPAVARLSTALEQPHSIPTSVKLATLNQKSPAAAAAAAAIVVGA